MAGKILIALEFLFVLIRFLDEICNALKLLELKIIPYNHC